MTAAVSCEIVVAVSPLQMQEKILRAAATPNLVLLDVEGSGELKWMLQLTMFNDSFRLVHIETPTQAALFLLEDQHEVGI